MWVRREDWNRIVDAAGSLTSSNIRLEKSFWEMEAFANQWQRLYKETKAELDELKRRKV